MWTWIKAAVHSLLFDAGAFETKMRAFWGFIAGTTSALVLTVVATAGADFNEAMKEIQSWTHADWIARLGVGVLFAVANGRKSRSLTLDDIHQGLVARGAITPPSVKAVPPVQP